MPSSGKKLPLHVYETGHRIRIECHRQTVDNSFKVVYEAAQTTATLSQ
jgi:hypothetical protein